MKFTTALQSGLVLAAAFSFHAAQAQAKPEKLVTRDALRVCMNSEAELATRRKAMEPRNAQMREENAAIRAEVEQLKAEGERLEQSGASMDRFNRKIRTHNTRVAAGTAVAETYRADLEALNTALLGYNDKCGGITYSAEDKAAILKERESQKN
ncbi:MAG: hypothetical protein ABIU58_05380 [Ramlibacter sp.]